jgi:hypothetical protein
MGSYHGLIRSEGKRKMEFWASAEVHQPAFSNLDQVRRAVVPVLNAAFAESSLSKLHCKLRYVPIVVPPAMHGRYPSRSKLRMTEKIFDCSPTLDYDVFVKAEFVDQIREYLSGIALSGAYLSDLGASPQQIEQFQAILDNALDRVVAERLDLTRH